MSKLAFKMAWTTAAAGGVLVLALHLAAGPLPWWTIPGGMLVLGAFGYAFARRVIVARLELARGTLKQIRRHQFDRLEAAHLPRGDELNALVWEVYRTGLTLEKEIKELRKMENYRREFVGNVSHELKTPIFSIQGFAETLLEGALEDERVNRSFVRKILHNALRLNNLAHDLTQISRIETGELKMTMEAFDLRQVVREVVESLELAAQSKGVHLSWRPGDALPLVRGDRERIRQVLINLVDNALKYNNAGGHVEVVARRLPSDEVKVSVVDDGIGVAPQDVPRLTERFYRVDKSRSRDQGGTGLGLAIVKHILAAHERKLMVESVLDQGSTFGFTLPVAAAGTVPVQMVAAAGP